MIINPKELPYLPAEAKILPFDAVIELIYELRQRKKENEQKIPVVAQGKFDIVHRGHVGYLRAAAKLGFVIVGIENDEAVRMNSGAKRPINPLEDRMHMIAEFRSVGAVFAFEDAIPYDQPEQYTQRYAALGAPIVAPIWDPYADLKAHQAREAGIEIAWVDYRHENSTTRMLNQIGFVE